jgi:hypothetical protein
VIDHVRSSSKKSSKFWCSMCTFVQWACSVLGSFIIRKLFFFSYLRVCFVLPYCMQCYLFSVFVLTVACNQCQLFVGHWVLLIVVTMIVTLREYRLLQGHLLIHIFILKSDGIGQRKWWFWKVIERLKCHSVNNLLLSISIYNTPISETSVLWIWSRTKIYRVQKSSDSDNTHFQLASKTPVMPKLPCLLICIREKFCRHYVWNDIFSSYVWFIA